MFRKLLLLLIFILTVCASRLPQISPKDVQYKTEEIFQAHATYKKLTPELSERILKNFIEELDFSKTYFIESDIQKWLYPNEDMLKLTLESFKKSDFTLFNEIHEVMIKAIERRALIEKEVDATPITQKVNPEELKDLEWATSRGELLDRISKIRSLQMAAAEKLNVEGKEKFLELAKKNRLHREAEIITSNEEERKALILSNILKAFATSLDAHTNYFTPSEASQFAIQVQQRLFGIGAILRDSLDGFSVIRILEKSPAENKLKLNDRIIAVNKEPIVGMDITDAVELIRGEKGSKALLSVLRESKENKNIEKLEIEIIRDEIIIEEGRIETVIEPYGDGVIANVRLFSFYQDPTSSSAQDIRSALENIKKKNKLKGVILDLRSNAGGLLTQAVSTTGLFISKGIVVSIKDNSSNIQHLRNTENNIAWDGPLVVLINNATASAAEIVAQTLQDYGRAIVVGDEHSFGKGSFQIFTLDTSKNLKINPQGEYKVTRGKYYTVSGKTPQLKGVKSDIVIPGMLSELDIGEEFSKYPLENDEISPNFDDDLSDIPYIHRKSIGVLYKHHLQQKISTYTQFLDNLKKNSQTRLTSNKNYQNFLTEIKKKNFENEAIEIFGQNDLQLLEAVNITKDLVYLYEINDNHIE